MGDHGDEEEAENYKELKKYDRTHNFDDPDFFKNRPKVIYKKERGPSSHPPFPMRILEAVRRLFKSIRNFKNA